MNKEDRATFTLADIRAIRYLIIALGGISVGMLLITDRDSPVMVVGFITIVTIVPLAAIYLLRRIVRKKEPNKAPEPTPTSVTSPASESQIE